MHYGAAIGHGESGGAVMIASRKVDPLESVWREKRGIVDAFGMFVDVNPSVGRRRSGELIDLGDVTVIGGIPDTIFGIAGTHAAVGRNTTGAGPGARFLKGALINVGRTFERRDFAI